MTNIDENLEIRRKKLLYRAWYRGSKETDKILGFFVKKYLETFNEQQLNELEIILEEQDVDIYDWVSGKKPIPADLKNNQMLQNIIEFSFSDQVTEMGIKLGN